MTHTERVRNLKAALSIININFEKDETYVSILAMVDLVDNKGGETTIDDILRQNMICQDIPLTSTQVGGNVALRNAIIDKLI